MTRRTHRLIVLSLLALAAPLTQATPKVRAGEYEDQYAVAAGHYARQRWQQAFDAFARLPKLNHPLSRTVPFFQAEALHQMRQYVAARPLYHAYLEQDDNVRYRTLAQFRSAECLLFAGEHRQALAELRQFQRQQPKDSRQGHVHLYQGQCHLALGDPKAAQQAYLQALELLMRDDSYPELTAKCRFGMGKALQQSGDRRQANRFFRFLATSESEMADDALCQVICNGWAEGLAQEVAADIEDFRQRFPTSVHREDVELIAARSLRAQGQHRQAAELLVDVVDETTSQAVGGELLFEAGRAYHAAGAVDWSRRCFEQLTLRWPRHGTADDASYCLVLLSKPRQATSRCMAFRSAYPDSEYWPEVTELLAETHIQQLRFDEAVGCLQEWEAWQRQASETGDGGNAASLTPAAPPTHIAHLKLLACLGAKRHAEAVAAGRDIDVQQLPRSLRRGMLLAFGSALAKAGEPAEADRTLQQCLQLATAARDRETVHQCAAQRAIVLAERQQIEEAMEMALLSLPAEDDAATDRLTKTQAATLRYVAAKARQIGAATESSLMYEQLVRRGGNPDDRQCFVSALWQTNRRGLAICELAELQLLQPQAVGTRLTTLRAGRIWEQDGDPESALAAYRWLSEQDGDAGRVGDFYQGRLLEQLGEDEAAIALLSPLVSPADPGEPALANSERRSEPPNATSDSIFQAPIDAALYHLAWALADCGRAEQARATFARLAEHGRDQRLQLDAVFRTARLDVAAGRLVEARNRLDAALKQEPTKAPELAADELIWQMQMLRGHVAASQGAWAEVVQQVSHVAESDQSPPDVRDDAAFLVAEAYYRQRQLNEAAVWFERSTRLASASQQAPTWGVLAQLRQAQILASKRQWRAAARAAERLLDFHPQFQRRSEAAYLLGRAQAARGRFQAARDAYQRVLEMPEARGTVTAAKAQWMIGESFYHQRNYEQAVAAYHRVELLHQHPQWQSLALVQIAKCRREQQQPMRADRLLREVIRRFPKSRGAEEAHKEQLRVARTDAKAPG